MQQSIRINIGNNDLILETGKLALQADGAVTVQLGETVVFVAAVAANKPQAGKDFFPLQVDYREKASASGKFPGGYFKREGRPTEKEILTARMIDRPIRPLFPVGYFCEVQVMSILLSADLENDSDILAINGASAALTLSDIPWNGPLGAVRVGRINKQFVVNPTHSQMLDSDLDLIYVGNETDMVMIEGCAQELSEDEVMSAVDFAQGFVKQIVAAQKQLAQQAGVTKRQVALRIVPPALQAKANTVAGPKILAALATQGKQARITAIAAVYQELLAAAQAEDPKVEEGIVKMAFDAIQYEQIRKYVLANNRRPDGRALDQLRTISSEVSVLPRPHGSALFARGETQALAIVTLGSLADTQELDTYTGGTPEKRFMLHYNFPPFSTGETGRIAGPGRREIGHGALAERSLEMVLPTPEKWPYTTRITSEIMSSNGSTSMATVCAGCMALMDAGVPIKAPVAGISIGLITEPGNRQKGVLITDILGSEDHFGDMDFKVAGTRQGITGFQVDLKIQGLTLELTRQAFAQAKVARAQILDIMAKTLAAPRPELSKYAPRMETLRIPPDKIGLLIGPGGKTIKKITEETGCKIDIEDDGSVFVFSTNPDGMARAKEIIEGMAAEIEVGKIYRGKVVTIKEFGAFVEVLPGKDGLVHISELADFRVRQVEDVCKMGEEIWVKCIGVDEKGRVKLSRKAALAEKDASAAEKK
ncbi:MAG: polyribonucleotide nucleotidyltransferase [Verrucomicrobia bacterium GWF2_62_7]|nr:MAG: polyribonucleotide nucleotidyltransferase [Verrucomicrobia bacterium GWF2_62_7]